MFAILLILVLPPLLLLGYRIPAIREHRSNQKIATVPKKAPMSNAAKRLVKEFNALPSASRPLFDMEELVKALDIKHGDIEKIDNHFYDYPHDFTWKCMCRQHNRACRYPDYQNLHLEIEGIGKALAEQEHALKVAGVQASLDQIQELTQTLRQERELIESVTKELT